MRIFYPEYDTEGLVQALTQRLSALARVLPLKLMILFGSYAKGNYTAASDVDLLVVYAWAKRQDDYAIVKKTLGIPRLEPHLYTEEEYREMQEGICRLTEGGIVLFPAEREQEPSGGEGGEKEANGEHLR